MIEAKRHDLVDEQRPEQLADEWIYANALYPGKPIWLLAIGGLRDTRNATVTEKRIAILKRIGSLRSLFDSQTFHFAATSWFHLYSVIVFHVNVSHVYHRLVNDIRKGMLLHGVAVEPPTWLEELLSAKWDSIRSISTNPAVLAPVLESATWLDELLSAKWKPIRSISTNPAALAPDLGYV